MEQLYLTVIYKEGEIWEILRLHRNITVARMDIKDALLDEYLNAIELGELPDIGTPVLCEDSYCIRVEGTAISGCILPMETNDQVH